jgi:hypothetical protein
MTLRDSHPNPLVLDYCIAGVRSELKYGRTENSWSKPEYFSLPQKNEEMDRAEKKYQDRVAKSADLIFPEFFGGDEEICALDPRGAKARKL